MLGRELKAARRRLGWTQQRTAAAIGVALNTAARWERGELPISEPVARLISLLDRLEPIAGEPDGKQVRSVIDEVIPAPKIGRREQRRAAENEFSLGSGITA